MHAIASIIWLYKSMQLKVQVLKWNGVETFVNVIVVYLNRWLVILFLRVVIKSKRNDLNKVETKSTAKNRKKTNRNAANNAIT